MLLIAGSVTEVALYVLGMMLFLAHMRSVFQTSVDQATGRRWYLVGVLTAMVAITLTWPVFVLVGLTLSRSS